MTKLSVDAAFARYQRVTKNFAGRELTANDLKRLREAIEKVNEALDSELAGLYQGLHPLDKETKGEDSE